ncbi:MAG: hypothetical protein BGO68_05720 [Candidatus Amoebophilus sp. 36-38]|nr:MAG: hypothetical protein BGO68_05720 [Candidatus Amoebophilus sp. 36-38]
MGIKYLWDTNIVIYYLEQQFPPFAESFMDAMCMKYQPAISVITELELLCWKSTTKEDLKTLNKFISTIKVFELDKAIKSKAIEVRKLYKLKLPDAIIASTALVYKLTLLTRDINDFKNIKNLKLLNPYCKEVSGLMP